MQKFMRITVATLSITASTLILERAEALPWVAAIEGVALADSVEEVAYLYNRRRYCWYPAGWHGAGWYRCGYRLRRGYGWGGGEGWQGWSAPMMRQRPGRVGPGFPKVDPAVPPPGRPMRPVGEPRQKIDPVGPRGGMERQMNPVGARPAGPAPRGGAMPKDGEMGGGMGGGKAEPQGGGAAPAAPAGGGMIGK